MSKKAICTALRLVGVLEVGEVKINVLKLIVISFKRDAICHYFCFAITITTSLVSSCISIISNFIYP